MSDALSPCAVNVGFFLLRACGRPAAQLCPSCGNPVCAGHLVSADGGLLCGNCRPPAADTDDEGDSDLDDSDSWSSTPRNAPLPLGEGDQLSPEELGAFDQVAEFDQKKAKAGAFDS